MSPCAQAAAGPLVTPAVPLSNRQAAAGKAAAGLLLKMFLGTADDEMGCAGGGTVRLLCLVKAEFHCDGNGGSASPHWPAVVPVPLQYKVGNRVLERLARNGLRK